MNTTTKIKIKKKCSECSRIRPLAEYSSTSGRCDDCMKTPLKRGLIHSCLSCSRRFEAKSVFNKVCDTCKGTEMWQCETHTLQLEAI